MGAYYYDRSSSEEEEEEAQPSFELSSTWIHRLGASVETVATPVHITQRLKQLAL